MVDAVRIRTEHDEKALEDLLVSLLQMPCVTGEEDPICTWMDRRYASMGLRTRRAGNSMVVGELADGVPNVLLVCHLDVVPPTPLDEVPAVGEGMIVGRGASDMKAGLACAMSCFEDPALRAGPWNMVLLLYAGEEGPPDGNELLDVLAAVPELRQADFAVILEPTDLTVQLGCLGVFHAELTFQGTAAHSARPWNGDNALTGAGAFLTELRGIEPEERQIDGLPYRDVLTATQAWTGAGPGDVGARNVVPDRFTIYLDHRFAPDTNLEAAEAGVERLLAGRAEIRPVVRAPSAPPRASEPTVRAFIREVAAPVEAKQAWTDIARFAEIGMPAVNFGPGLTAQAHRSGEYVPVENLHAGRRALSGFLGASPPQ